VNGERRGPGIVKTNPFIGGGRKMTPGRTCRIRDSVWERESLTSDEGTFLTLKKQ